MEGHEEEEEEAGEEESYYEDDMQSPDRKNNLLGGNLYLRSHGISQEARNNFMQREYEQGRPSDEFR